MNDIDATKLTPEPSATFTNRSVDIGKIILALSKAQGQFTEVKKTKTVDFTFNGKRTHYAYADLNDIMNCCKKALAENELAVTQITRDIVAKHCLETILAHSSGEWISSTRELPNPASGSPQAYGSALTYGRKYSYCSILGVVAEEDDDGQSASDVTDKNSNARAKPRPANAKSETKGSAGPSDAQLNLLYATVKNRGFKLDEIKGTIKTLYNISSTTEFNKAQFQEFLNLIKAKDRNQVSEYVAEVEAERKMKGSK